MKKGKKKVVAAILTCSLVLCPMLPANAASGYPNTASHMSYCWDCDKPTMHKWCLFCYLSNRPYVCEKCTAIEGVPGYYCGHNY